MSPLEFYSVCVFAVLRASCGALSPWSVVSVCRASSLRVWLERRLRVLSFGLVEASLVGEGWM